MNIPLWLVWFYGMVAGDALTPHRQEVSSEKGEAWFFDRASSLPSASNIEQSYAQLDFHLAVFSEMNVSI